LFLNNQFNFFGLVIYYICIFGIYQINCLEFGILPNPQFGNLPNPQLVNLPNPTFGKKNGKFWD
jgi:hypothetical protein